MILKKITTNPRGKNRDYKLLFGEIEKQAAEIIKSCNPFTFEVFYKKFFSISDETDLFNQMKLRAEELRSEGRISTAVTFECALKSLQDYTGKAKLSFEDVTPAFLKDYENWMVNKGRSKTTVGIYARNIRTLFKASEIKGLQYPFGLALYRIPTGRNVKKALTFEQVNMIAAFNAIPGTWEERARDYWLFSYLGNGLNIKDMALLKYQNIEGDVIRFVRAKTAASTDREFTIEIPITQRIGRIIDKWGSRSSDYIFPILTNGMTPEQEYKAIQKTVHNINDNIKKVAQQIGITANITTYWARHSFATVLKRSGASVDFIQESLGHTSANTTQSYLDSFEIEKKREYANNLLSEDQQR